MASNNELNQKKTEFKENYPDLFFLDATDPEALTAYLLERKIIQSTVLKVEKAGEGNMNLTLRVYSDSGNFIIKQSRPWVEKYPSIPAPMSRAGTEGKFYSTVNKNVYVGKYMPDLLDADEESNTLLLEDLGDLASLESLYAGRKLLTEEMKHLMRWIGALHSTALDQESLEALENRSMRELNHEHIFKLPLQPNNGLDLDAITPGLKRSAQKLIDDPVYVQRVEALGELYLENRNVLLHGDYYPGSWMLKDGEIYVIDPEFCFTGHPAFDLGVCLAHMALAGQDELTINTMVDFYPLKIDTKKVLQFAGVEIMRRIIGVAQLPLNYGMPKKQALLEKSMQWVKG
jgi:5-methylthioribose kinase